MLARHRTAIPPPLPPPASCRNRSATETADCPRDGPEHSTRPETSDRFPRPSRSPDPALQFSGAGRLQTHGRRCCGGSGPARLQGSFSSPRVLVSFPGTACFLGNYLLRNCSFLSLACHSGRRLHSLPTPSLCKPLAILRKLRFFPLPIVLDAPSPPHVAEVLLPGASSGAIVCRLRELPPAL